MIVLRSFIQAWLAVLVLSTSSFVAGAPPENPLVEVSASLDPTTPVVPGQRVRLIINVATPRWFTSGTRIKLPEVPGVVLLQNQDFATNATERRGAESWSVQRWSIDVFATEAGTLVIPPVAVTVSVSKTPSQEYKDTLTTRSLELQVEIPPELQDLDSWIASPRVSLEQSLEHDTEVPLGGAIKRRVIIKADNVMAMQLPAVPAPDHPLLQTYPEPPVLRNRANRGSLTAERRDTVTWIATAPGEVKLPAVTLNWWNTETRALEVLTTESVQIPLTGELPPRPLDQETLIARLISALGLLVIALVIWRLYRLGLLQKMLGWLLNGVRIIWQHSRQLWRAIHDPVLPTQLNPGGTRSKPLQ